MSTVEPRVRTLQRRLLRWYADEARDLPWRRTDDAYAILVSELMLQQTQVARVRDAWVAFLERFPTVRQLAVASPASVVDAWQGLGYNRRAINLHRAAQVVVDEHSGVVPSDVEALEALPGIGPYTARAVATFAYGQATAPVDVNIARVLSRAVANAPLGRTAVGGLAEDMVGALEISDVPTWNHALMDLGAGYCTARGPRCETCPVASECAWRAAPGSADPAGAGGMRSRPQRRFEDSDRYHRGRLVDALRAGGVEADDLGEAAHLRADPSRLERIVAGLVADGLVQWQQGRLTLPGDDR